MAFKRYSVTALLALGLGAPLPALAQDDAAFREGLRARDDKRWPDVETQMRLAIQSNPEESDRRVGGGFFFSRGTQYLPHFFLGEALFRQENCAGAVAAWSVSEEQGAVRSRSDFVAFIQEGYKTCASRGVLLAAEYDQLLRSTTQTITAVTGEAAKLSERGEARPDIWRPEMTVEYKRASGALETARKHLTAARSGRLRSEFDAAKRASDAAAEILRTLASTVDAAVEAVASLQQQAKEVERILADASKADKALDEFTPIMTPDLRASRQRGRNLVTEARARLVNGGRPLDAAAVNEARRQAQDAAAAFGEVRNRARQLSSGTFEERFGLAVAAAADAFSSVDGSLERLDRLVLEKGDAAPANLAADRGTIEKRMPALRNQFDRAQKARNLGMVEDVARRASDARDALAGLVAAFGPVSLRDRGVPPALEEGARLYFAGEHRQALSVLNGALTPATVPHDLALHVHLFRAAAAFTLYVRSGETDQAFLQQARTEAGRCKQINPAFVPDARAFAPRFITFFKAVSATPDPGDAAAEP